MIPPFQHFPDFTPPDVFHGFFGRRGGVSTGLYESLNCGLGSQDNPASVAENRARVARAAGARDLVTLYQVHGATCLYMGAPLLGERPQADAVFTDQPGLALGVLTADCVPVLFYGQNTQGRRAVAAAHAGWRGALGGILESTIRMFADHGFGPQDIRAAIGPAIGQASYEVGDEVFQTFVEQNKSYAKLFKRNINKDSYQFDIKSFCYDLLLHKKLQNIYLSHCDTYAESDAYFSYRRTTHRGEKDYGRQVSVIALSR
ncbi:MAG: peptidoglycan editing factor PgeF [Alphaproteobacteria bacterium]|nr:peptidoglycan editing factor PgeF [Alphaproteobacteria bacterium]